MRQAFLEYAESISLITEKVSLNVCLFLGLRFSINESTLYDVLDFHDGLLNYCVYSNELESRI
jgi:hypothetical protein